MRRKRGEVRFETGEIIARQIVLKLWPHVEHIDIAGSIRRRKKWVNDIDLVAIPKFESRRMLVPPEKIKDTDFYEAVCRLARRLPELPAGEMVVGERNCDPEPECSGEKIVRVTSYTDAWGDFPMEDFGIDIYIATRESWAMTMLIRTGSKEHNIWLAQRAHAIGGKLHADGRGLELPGQYDHQLKRNANFRLLKAETEEQIFKALGMPEPMPTVRECANGRPVWLGYAAGVK